MIRVQTEESQVAQADSQHQLADSTDIPNSSTPPDPTKAEMNCSHQPLPKFLTHRIVSNKMGMI